MKPNFLWPTPSILPPLSNDQVHVWSAPLNQPAEYILQLAQALSPDEAARAQRFVFDRDRDHFIAARGLLRIILGHYLNLKPQQIKFCYGPQNKPGLEIPQSQLRFNLSHSGNAVLYAITHHQEIGVDIELLRPLDDMMQIAKRFFSPAEYAALRALPIEKQEIGFFNCWTRKEAYIKALGSGLTQPLDQFDVSLIPGQPAKLLQVQNDPQALERWSLTELNPASNYAAALVVEGQNQQFFCGQWPGLAP
jgi:4'-phosphopantetheinyl transferase